MKGILEKEMSFFKEKNLSIIDKKYQNNKVSVRFGSKMVDKGKLPNKQEYLDLWMKYYSEHSPSTIKGDT